MVFNSKVIYIYKYYVLITLNGNIIEKFIVSIADLYVNRLKTKSQQFHKIYNIIILYIFNKIIIKRQTIYSHDLNLKKKSKKLCT